MPWLDLFFVVVLIAALAALFTVHARLVRRDLEDRFNKFQARLEEEATTVVDDLLNEQTANPKLERRT
jgi:membrane protein implicated in regulation of membrane protease activity